jgi:hypothetical protein
MLEGASVLHPCPLLVDICYCDDYNKPGICYLLVIKHPKCFEIFELHLPVMELEHSSYLDRSYLDRSYLDRSFRSYRVRFYPHLFHPNLPYLYLSHLTQPTHLARTLTRLVNALTLALAPPPSLMTYIALLTVLLVRHSSTTLLPSFLPFFLSSFLPFFLSSFLPCLTNTDTQHTNT